MLDSKQKERKWNVTFFDYSANAMNSELLSNYGKDILHAPLDIRKCEVLPWYLKTFFRNGALHGQFHWESYNYGSSDSPTFVVQQIWITSDWSLYS